MPLVAAVTLTLMVQVLLAATPPVYVIEVAPPIGEKEGETQPAEVDAAGVLATLICAGELGSGSVRLTPVTADVLVLVMTIDNVEVPPPVMDTGENALDIVNGDVIVAMRPWVEKSLL